MDAEENAGRRLTARDRQRLDAAVATRANQMRIARADSGAAVTVEPPTWPH